MSRDGEMQGAVWSDDAPLVIAFAELITEGGMHIDDARSIAEVTRDRGRDVLQGSQERIDHLFCATFARAARSAGQLDDAYEAIGAVHAGPHADLVADLADDAWLAWAAFVPFHAPWSIGPDGPTIDAPDGSPGPHEYRVMSFSTMTMNGVSSHELWVTGARSVTIWPDDLPAVLAATGTTQETLSQGSLRSNHTDADVALSAALLAGRRAAIEQITRGMPAAFVAAVAQGDFGPVSALFTQPAHTRWLVQAAFGRSHGGAYVGNESWLEAVRAGLPEGFALNRDDSGDNPLGPDSLVLSISGNGRSGFILFGTDSRIGSTPIG